MKYSTQTFPKNVARASLVATTFVIAMASPAGAVSTTLSASSSLDLFKQTITSAIDTSITKLQTSAQSLDSTLSVNIDKNGASGSVSGPSGSASGSVNSNGASGTASTNNGSTASGSVSSDGATGSASTSNGSSVTNTVTPSSLSSAITYNTGFLESLLSIPKELIQKLQDTNKKAIETLKSLKTEVQATANVQDVQVKAKQFDQQFKQVATANVQATVTKSIDSQAQVLEVLQNAANSLQTQVNRLKECVQGGSASASGNASSSSASGSINASAPGCTSFNVDANSGDNGQSLQDQLDEIKSSLKTIRAFLSSSISLVGTLKDGNYSGTIKSFQGVDSQMDIVASLSADAKNSLVNLSAAVNK